MTSISSDRSHRFGAPLNADSQSRLDSVTARLRMRERVYTLAAALGRLHWTDVCVLVDMPRLFEDEPDLPDRIRGGLGRALETLAMERKKQTPNAATAWDLLFGERRSSQTTEPIRPYAIRIDRWQEHWIVAVRLFGFADCWAGDVSLALPQAFTNGIAIKQGSKHRVRLVHSESWRSPQWLATLYCPTRSAIVRLASPLVMRSGQAVHMTTRNLASALLRRAQAIAAWCDIDLQPNRDEYSAVDTAWIMLSEELLLASWLRRSVNQPRGQAISGLTGRVTLHRISDTGLGLLSVAEAFHAGGGSASGLGRIRVIAM